MATSDDGRAGVLARLFATIEARKGADPASSYVASLLAKGGDAILKKIGEEATETVMASKDGVPARVTAEVADLWFHCLVLLAHHAVEFGHRQPALLGEQLGLQLVVDQRVELALVVARDEPVALVHPQQPDLAQAHRVGERVGQAHLSGSPPAA